MKCGEKGTGKSHLEMLRKDLYPRLEGRNLARWAIRTSHIAIEPDTHLPQYPVRCQVDTGRTALELSDVLVSSPSMLIPSYLDPPEPDESGTGLPIRGAYCMPRVAGVYCAARRTSSVHEEAHPNGRHSYLSRFTRAES